MTRTFRISLLMTGLALLAVGVNQSSLDAAELKLQPGDHIAYIGNTLADRMQHHSWLETYIHALHPEHHLTVRNLGFSGDELRNRPRSQNFGSPDQWLAKVEADVIFCFFGYNEALRGEAGLADFRKNLGGLIDEMHSKNYNGDNAPKLVFFSPIAHENVNSRHLPDGSANNAKLKIYTQAMQAVCAEKKVDFVDLFTPSANLYASAKQPLTMNGIHLLDHGNKALAEVIVQKLFPAAKLPSTEMIAKLREAVLEKNYYWFSRYRVVDGYNVYGGRSKLAWFGQSNADVMLREMEVFDVMTANRDKVVWAAASGQQVKPDDTNIPELLAVQTNKPGPLPGGKWPYESGKDAIKKMDIAEGMQVNLFASEERFPRLVNPVQIAVDTDSRLWVSVWPSYPHWNPTERREDALLIFPDEDQDGEADECIVFADELNSITSFEFWGGGVLVAAPPEIWFLKDTDGDDKADVKIRLLQGVSSADTHHSANAMVVGPDGWLYWSRGVFNVANFETPTKTFRSGQTGVYRFNPRTYEIEFHFPIGPNPHGDVIDQWGFQFVNDGTGGTGSYVNIGKGIGNKKWFKKRVRPVPATGILDSSHFPEENKGNFLICNAIGFLGVAQHEVKYNGADITAEEIEPIVVSSDPNFRPSDVEIGGDGALYIADWHNTLIGHMQHNMRDPNRDHEHGRIYRVTAQGRPTLKPAKMKGKPIANVVQNFFARENATRYRARLELTGREEQDIVAEVGKFAATLDPLKADKQRDEAQALLECLWVFEEQRLPNMKLLKKVFKAKEPRVRAAAIRTLGHWAGRVTAAEPLLIAAAQDDSAMVRAEAVKAAVEFKDAAATAVEVIFETGVRPLDPELETVLAYAKSKVNLNQVVQQMIDAGQPLSPAGQAYALLNTPVATLLKMKRTPAVYEAILNRTGVETKVLRESLEALAKERKQSSAALLIGMLTERDKQEEPQNLAGLGQLLTALPAAELKSAKAGLEKLAAKAEDDSLRKSAYAAWIVADGSGNGALFAASKSEQSLREMIAAIPLVPDADLRGSLYQDVRSLLSELPPNLKADTSMSAQKNGIQVDYFFPNPKNVAIETLEELQPQASGIVPEIVMNVPQRLQVDRFALRFTGLLQVPRSGKYTFSIASDDGSRVYVADKLVVNNDGLHGMVEKQGEIQLSAGLHPLVVTYFDNGGGDGLKVAWSGPRLRKQPISADRLMISGGETVHDVAIRSLASIPGHDAEKFRDLAKLVRAGRHRPAAISVLGTLPKSSWDQKQIPSLVDNLVGFLSTIPAASRTSGTAVEATELVRSLGKTLPANRQKQLEDRLQNLDVQIIAIGTVPARMIYDKEQIAVQAGKPVEFRFSNSDQMPHNFAIVQPGSLEEVGQLAEATGNAKDAKERNYIPVSKKILLGSKILEPGESQTLTFEAPTEPGVYPYVCTYPGHWRRMYGALYVVADLEGYLSNPEEYLAANPLPLKDELLKYTARNTEWTYEQLIGYASPIPHGRSFAVGKNLFKVANCVACHKLNDEGRNLGPDLAKLDAKKITPEHILRSMVDPSKDIDEKFQSNTFQLDSGKVVTGLIIEETADVIKVQVDPLAKADPLVIDKSSIIQRKKSTVSIMPKGLLNKLTQEEILDLIAYIHAGGNMKHKMYHMGHNH